MQVPIEEMVARVTREQACLVYPPGGAPCLDSSKQLPEDLRHFYQLCGGMQLFLSSPFTFEIVPPDKFVLANRALFPGLAEEEYETDDISGNWFLIATGDSRESVSIDLTPSRLGRCYDSSFDRHAIIGDCPIIAMSFSEFLYRSLETGGNFIYWTQANFEGYGDAYD